MPLITKTPTAPPDVKPIVPSIQSVSAKSNVVDTSKSHLGNLAVYSQGFVYVVNYYANVIGRDQATYGLDAAKNNVQQQYRKISRLEIKLQESLRSVQDNETKRMNVEGSGLVMAGLIPNEGDLFTADAGDGREAVFQVHLTEKTSIFNEAVYRVDFRLMYFSYAEPTKRADLENKVVEKLHYIRDYARYGRDPIIGDATYDALRRLYVARRNMIDDYLAWFISRDRSTIVLPGQVDITSDPFLTTMIHRLVSPSDYPELGRVRELNIDDENLSSEPTLWQVLVKRRKELLRQCRTKATTVRTRAFYNWALFQSARYSGIDVLVYPTGGRAPVDDRLNNLEILGSLNQLESPAGAGAFNTEMSDRSKPVMAVPLVGIHPVTIDDFYVLSEAFYAPSDTNPMSMLEKLTMDFLEGEMLDAQNLLWLADSYTLWGELEKFYYIPLLIVLIQSLIQEAI